MSTPKKNAPAKKAAKLPSKQISFGNQANVKGGKAANAAAPTGKKGGVNLMRKLSGM